MWDRKGMIRDAILWDAIRDIVESYITTALELVFNEIIKLKKEIAELKNKGDTND